VRLFSCGPNLTGSLITHADLTSLDSIFNEIVVDGRGNAYINARGAGRP
jgi:hypothetical protein